MRSFLLALFALGCSGPDDGTPTPSGTTDTVDTASGSSTNGTTTTGPTGTDPCDGVTPSVTIGNGVFSYEPIEDGQPTEIVYGSQGGWHLDTAGAVTGLGPVIQFKGTATVLATGDVIAGENDQPVVIDLRVPGAGTWDKDTCTGTFYGQFTFVDDVDLNGDTLIKAICSIDEEDVEFALEVSELEGEPVSDSVVIFARIDPETGCP